MQTVLDRFDTRRGIIGFLVVVSLLAGIFVVSAEINGGDRGAVWDFLLFAIVLIGASVYGRWYVDGRTDPEAESGDRG